MKIVAALAVTLIGSAGAFYALETQVASKSLALETAKSVSKGNSSGGIFTFFLGNHSSYTSVQDVFKLAEVQEKSISDIINTTGTLIPVALVSVSSLVSGQVKELLVDFNTDVKEGDALAVFDPVTFEHALMEAEAVVAIGQANKLKATITLREAESDLQRKRSLYESGSGALTDQNKSIAARDLAAANLLEANATLKKGDAAVSQAKTNLARATIRSPITGTIINRNVEIGQVLAVSLAVPTLFTIAKDLTAMQLDALVSEGDIGRVRVGQRVAFTVDTYPDRVFRGNVLQIRKQPQNNQNVVLYTVIVATPNPERVLLPGMTATTQIIIDERPPALSVPNAALRVRISKQSAATSSQVFVAREGLVVPVVVERLSADSVNTQVESENLHVGDQVVVGLLQRGLNAANLQALVGGF